MPGHNPTERERLQGKLILQLTRERDTVIDQLRAANSMLATLRQLLDEATEVMQNNKREPC
jgi:hypothetical protein